MYRACSVQCIVRVPFRLEYNILQYRRSSLSSIPLNQQVSLSFSVWRLLLAPSSLGKPSLPLLVVNVPPTPTLYTYLLSKCSPSKGILKKARSKHYFCCCYCCTWSRQTRKTPLVHHHHCSARPVRRRSMPAGEWAKAKRERPSEHVESGASASHVAEGARRVYDRRNHIQILVGSSIEIGTYDDWCFFLSVFYISLCSCKNSIFFCVVCSGLCSFFRIYQ